MNSNSTFNEEDINNISPKESIKPLKQKIDRNKILDYIKENAPLTPYRLSKNLDIAYTTISQICKEFNFVGLIKFRVVVGDNNRTHKLICLPNGEIKNEN